MNRVFRPRGYFTVPDGSAVSPFLNATDVMQTDLPWNALGEVSIASGRIAPGTQTWIHVHPASTQVSYLVAGAVTVRMKDASVAAPYDVPLAVGDAAVVPAGTLVQLRNDGAVPAEVLYVVSPSYVFELDGDRVRHDDAILVAKTWEALAAGGDDVPALTMNRGEAVARRAEALRRLAKTRSVGPRPLASESICPLKETYDYPAPDGSEIRLLVRGEHGSLAHCLLPAGCTSVAVRHRTVEELWYVLEGAGDIWRGRDGEPARVDTVRAGDSVRIPVDTAFQFRASQAGDLKLLLATMPPWPESQEAVPAEGGLNT